MRYRLLGRSGLLVSEICLGTMTYGGKGRWQPIGQLGLAEVETQIKAAFDAGVNFIDTADVYSEGDSEALVGQALANLGLPREQLVIASKVRIRMGPGPNQVCLSRGHIIDGAKTKEQLADNVAATDLTLSAAELQSLDEVSRLPPEYPDWMFDRQNRDRFPGGAIR